MTPARLAVAALLISCAALAIALYALGSRSTDDKHRCGTDGYVVSCISNDTPADYKDRDCVPRATEGRVTIWDCSKP